MTNNLNDAQDLVTKQQKQKHILKAINHPRTLLRSAPSDNAKAATLVINYNCQFPSGTKVDDNLSG